MQYACTLSKITCVQHDEAARAIGVLGLVLRALLPQHGRVLVSQASCRHSLVVRLGLDLAGAGCRIAVAARAAEIVQSRLPGSSAAGPALTVKDRAGTRCLWQVYCQGLAVPQGQQMPSGNCKAQGSKPAHASTGFTAQPRNHACACRLD